LSDGLTSETPVLPEIILVCTTFATKEDAMKMASSLLELRLAACVQVSGPLTSMYPWEGTLHTSDEFSLLAKTTPENSSKVQHHIQMHHPYDLPEILQIQADASQQYASWVKQHCDSNPTR